jgi:senataxin
MHPDISTLPSAVFYQGRLQDGPNMALATKQVWHANPDFGPYRFFDVAGNEEVPMAGYSFVNRTECAVAVALFNRLRTAYPQLDFDRRVGVVSMYRAQVSELKRQFEARFGRQVLEQVDFQTVDGFQGQEKDIIILSCVRGGPRVESVGFLADERRMNVAITRSRSSLFILGNAPTLERSNQTWQMIVQDARARKFLIKVRRYIKCSGRNLWRA